MKLNMILLSLFCVSGLVAQNYDYDDIYFNPKKDLKKDVKVVDNGITSQEMALAFVTDGESQIVMNPQFDMSSGTTTYAEIGRASCRERVPSPV